MSGIGSIEDLIGKALSGELNVREVPDYSKRELIVPIDVSMPWAKDGIPMSVGCDLSMLRMNAGEEKLVVKIPGITSDEFTFSEEGLRLLGHATGYKVDFIKKMPLNLQADIINHCCMQHRNQIVQLSGYNNIIDQLSPGWRHLCSHAEVAQLAYNTLTSKLKEVKIESYVVNEGLMILKLSTNRKEKVTAKRGDVLIQGLKVVHRPGINIEVAQFIKRLECENGMTSECQQFPWINQKCGSLQDQLDFLVKGIYNSLDGFKQVVEKAKEMAATPIHGEPREALLVRAKSMKIPIKYTQHLVDAYDAEPGATEWDMLNALTRFGTHSRAPGVTAEFREAIQTSAGSWTASFDLVNARMPRSIAEFVGADIINNN